MTATRDYIYETIAAEVAEKIRTGVYPAGKRLPSDGEQAQEYGVNSLTVRKAMLILQEKGLITRSRGRGSFVLGPSKRQRSLLYIGDLEGHFYKDLFLHLQAAGQSRDTRVAGFSPVERSLEQACAELIPYLNESDTVIYAADPNHCDLLPFLMEREARAIVLTDRKQPYPGAIATLSFCPSLGVELAATYLIESCGHRRIGLLTRGYPDKSTKDHIPADCRWNPSFRAFHGMTSRDDIGLETSTIGMHVDEDEANLRSMLHYLDREDRPTAILCDLDFRARLVYEAAAALGLSIPNDISVIGVGNTPWSEALVPALTTTDRAVKAGANLILQLAATATAETPISCILTPSLVARQSCKVLQKLEIPGRHI
ncbi:MAG: substrate-binding domain-containing protein [Planctomycetota bacterium]|jgi:DNA-binding LacI/PurR family transcriptional regulator